MKKLLCTLLFISLCSGGLFATDHEEEYQFYGRHFIASYYDCDHAALTDLKQLEDAMNRAVAVCGAQNLKSSKYIFEPDALTMVILLSESHASIHTYPEKNACFVDLFTCGTNCSSEAFDKVLRDYLKPQKVSADLIERQ
ncbi:MAG: adenosylmethionine decarboxylase [Verrucomicrobia bacterium]|nr:adenosylmethionine decarboxylase [Verrucomicrobiota bacterium]